MLGRGLSRRWKFLRDYLCVVFEFESKMKVMYDVLAHGESENTITSTDAD